MDFVIVSGLSGAGKSVAIKSFEDIGYYCVDNLPTALIPTFTDLIVQSKIERVALGIDVRERDFFEGLFEMLDGLQNDGHRIEILFLEAREDVRHGAQVYRAPDPVTCQACASPLLAARPYHKLQPLPQ